VDLRPWSTRRWIQLVLAAVVIQGGAAALLVRSPARTPSRPTFATRIHLVVAPESQRRLDQLPGYLDPSLFAWPSLQGFSGSAWLRYPGLVSPPIEHAETPEWLRLKQATLGVEFLQFVSTNTLQARLLVEEPLPPVSPYDRWVGRIPSESVAPSSRLRIEGDLAQRGLASPILLRSWPHSEIVSNTTIRAVVDAAGDTFSVTLLGRSGLAVADDYALRVVEKARFGPLPPVGLGKARGEEMSWGTITFLWHTAPLTNAGPELP
jgi:hypothetical protein